jgi:hypothetical protein
MNSIELIMKFLKKEPRKSLTIHPMHSLQGIAMIELTFQEFHEHLYVESGFTLYVLKNRRGDALYVGVSTKNIWERWFGFGGHMVWDGKVIYGESPIGVKIEDHLPDSLRWKIELWTLHDCVEYCQHELHGRRPTLDIHDLEPIMIQKLSPAFNMIYNLRPGKDTTPKSTKEIERETYLDKMFREIFDQRK